VSVALHLPPLLADVAEAVDAAGADGHEAALGLARAWGGGRVYVPRSDRIGPEHPWAIACGSVPAAQAAAEVLGPGEIRDIPLGPAGTAARRRAAIQQANASGLSHDAIARLLGVDRSTVRRALARPIQPSPQLDLFGDDAP
jgi:DNA-binding NarL/FixJ family response regulator